MKLNRAILSIVVFSAISSMNAFASDNTITFLGEVADETCSVTVNGVAASPTVLLPTVSASSLTNAADTAGQTTFDIGVSECTGSSSGVTISTVFVGNNVSSGTGNLINTGTAGNVEIQVLDTSDAAIDFRNNFNGAGDLSLAADETSASATYTAQYYSTGGATTGTVESSMQYSVSYQ
ncbi:fimbrial protein [Klebsiella sp. WP7-S18-CRE-02]|uniref:Type 1 fimbrial protein n=1 Tax=Kluyvera genomosp. 2 TaxID=2774054 RepID=A0A2T2XWP9_9ENTR|nr:MULTISPECIES: fimbrial protein [Enterobacteriaceae]HAT3920664.1 type 1 fimbrial protein [Kluyvera ascorbata]PSR44730.1 type 1 fimbrial protein [Kluyvera genomosp. 2]BBQ83578.1 fimbrial protein [Klebsiella sp. WP3-W18-ESBL-02]BBR20601.1 fimbrial protein [Klebsiella sp. WP3-S18-ESBL-05]BBS91435.1 fimbrial protein [Klebsiella sp. WP7-S18-CRE-02]